MAQVGSADLLTLIFPSLLVSEEWGCASLPSVSVIYHSSPYPDCLSESFNFTCSSSRMLKFVLCSWYFPGCSRHSAPDICPPFFTADDTHDSVPSLPGDLTLALHHQFGSPRMSFVCSPSLCICLPLLQLFMLCLEGHHHCSGQAPLLQVPPYEWSMGCQVCSLW